MNFITSFHQSLNLNGFTTKDEPFPSELYLQGLILQNPNLLSFEKGAEPSILDNELTIGKGANNRIDIVINDDDNIGVVELKKGEINKKALKQLRDYLSKRDSIIKTLIGRDSIDKENSDSKNLYGVLVGSQIQPDVIQQIKKNNEDNSKPKIYVIILKRYVTEKEQVFITSNAVITPSTNKNDYSRYEFNGNVYGKGRLVLAVIKHLVENKTIVSNEELHEHFPKTTQGSHEITKSIYSINENSKNSTIDKRYFINDPIEISGEMFAVTNQWGVRNIDKFIEKAEKLKCQIKKL